mgnify:CR=1 FL=1
MGKKSFKTSFDDLLDVKTTKSNKFVSRKQNFIKATFLIDEENLEKLRAISFFTKKKQKNLLDEILNVYIKNYESQNGKINLPK